MEPTKISFSPKVRWFNAGRLRLNLNEEALEQNILLSHSNKSLISFSL